MDLFNLDKKVALITGGNGGIGYAMAKAIGDAGANIIIAGRNVDKNTFSVNKLKNSNIEAMAIEVDVDDEFSCQNMVNQVVDKFKKIDVLVNAIGICRNKDAVDVSKEEWDNVININVNSMFYLCKEFGKIFIKNKKGCIVNIGSNSGLIVDRPQPQASYNASKAAVHQLTKSLACEWARYNIRVNAIAPGYVATKMTLLGRKKPNWFKYWIDMTPMKRLAEPSEIASAVLFLTTDSSSYCTGTILSVDGGYTSW